MDDKTRVLLHIICELRATQTLGPAGRFWGSEHYQDRRDGRIRTHFALWDHQNLQPGDLVICDTSGIHDFTVAYIDHILSSHECLLREIGSQRRCRMSNEQFTPIRGLFPEMLWEGKQREFYRRVLKVFRVSEWLQEWQGKKLNCLWHRFRGVEYVDETTARIWIGERYGGLAKPSKPYSVLMRWNPLPTQKAILAILLEHGYGWQEFDRMAEQEQWDTGRLA